MQRYLFLLLSALLALNCFADETLKVTTFTTDPADQMALKRQRNDLNGNPCALVIVQTKAPMLRFYGNVIGDVERYEGDYYVYMTDGSKKLQIQSAKLAPLRVNTTDFNIDQLKGGQTYRMTLQLPQMAENADLTGDAEDYSQPKHLSLAAVKDDRMYYFTRKQWEQLADKDAYEKRYIAIIDNQEQFLLHMKNYGYFERAEIQPEWHKEIMKLGQVQAIIDDLENIQAALEFYGGEPLMLNTFYWFIPVIDGEGGLSSTDFNWKYARETNMIADPSQLRPVWPIVR